MRIFQLITPQRPAVTARLARVHAGSDTTVVFDLEDGLCDPQDETRTATIKAAGRERVRELADCHAAALEGVPVGVRINRVSSPEAKLDMAMLAESLSRVALACVVVPKVETGADLWFCRELLREAGLTDVALVPIVETRRGLANLSDIVRDASAIGVRWVVYGHYDFALDSGWWPFPDLSHEDYWDVAGPFIAQVEAGGLGFVQPPHFRLGDEPSFVAALDRLDGACDREFGVLAVNSRQVAVARAWTLAPAPLAPAPLAPAPLAPAPLAPAPLAPAAAEGARPADDRSPSEEARRIVAAYEANRRPDVSFAVDVRTGEFIPPHVYIGAREYLRRSAR